MKTLTTHNLKHKSEIEKEKQNTIKTDEKVKHVEKNIDEVKSDLQGISDMRELLHRVTWSFT